ncbi:MAG: amino acid permease [Desulfurobacterium sp.]|nr:MAG: amino acid permease [Desulfurobacterium sp.]
MEIKRENKLHRIDKEKLGIKELIAIGVGGMIGGGIFSILGVSVNLAGNGAPLSFLIDMIIALTAGYHYVKLALTYKDDGASYTYIKKAFPDKPWIAGIEGWIVILGYIGTLALYSFTFGAYGADLLGVSDSYFIRAVLSAAVLLFFFYINLRGVKSSGISEDIIVYGKILILFLFSIIGLLQVKTENFFPVLEKGIPSVFLGAAIIFVAYEGFQLITNAVVETENPDKNIPRGIYGSILITGTIYFLLSIIAVGTLTYQEIISAKEYALAVVAEPILGKAGKVLIGVAALMATSSAINSTLFGASRMMAEMAETKMMPAGFAKRNRKFVPVVSLFALTFFSLIFTAFGTLTIIAEFSSLTFLVVSIGVSIANLKLRRLTKPNFKIALLGLGLMIITTATIVIYLTVHNLEEIITIGALYAVIALTATIYIKSQNHNLLNHQS